MKNGINKKPKFVLASNVNENDETKKFSFYQICGFSYEGKHEVRKLVYDEQGNLLYHNTSRLSKEILDNFIKKSPVFKYTIYPTYNLDIVGFPDNGEILMAISNILNY